MKIIPLPKKIQCDEQIPCAIRELTFQKDRSIVTEGYRLEINEDATLLRYNDNAGKYYGTKTFKTLLDENNLYCGVIEDAPTYAYRGVHMDVARYFLTIAEIKAFIDVIATLNFNVLHLHLNDEQGWRLDVCEYPKLTKIGSKRPYSNFGKTMDKNPHEGFYTKEELMELVVYAKRYFINILPAIDVPGHCSAILESYPEYSCLKEHVKVKTRGGVYKDILCAGNDDVYKMLYTVIDTLCEIFPYPYIHIGGDEAQKDHWRRCPKCQAKMKEEQLLTVSQLQDYFINKLICYIKQKGKRAIMFNDGLQIHHHCKDVDIQYWIGDKEETKKILARGQHVIVATHGKYYLDLGYGQTSLRSAYMYDPACDFAPYEEQVMGVEGMLWAEFMPTYERRLYQAFPRLLAISETAWNGNQKQPYEQFEQRCLAFVKDHHITCASRSLWDMTKPKRIWDALNFYKQTMNKQDRKQFIATIKNGRKERKENENIIRNNTD